METPNETLASQPLIEHLVELRRRLMWAVATFFVASCLCYLAAGDIYAFLVQPLADALDNAQGRRLIYTGLAEVFVSYLKLSVFAGFLLSFPIIAGQFYLYLAPGLYKNERKALLPYLIAAPVMFLIGAAFVYYGVFPAAWKFFLGFETGGDVALPIQLEAKVADYLGLVMHLIVAFGLAFQLPVVLVLLVRSHMMKLETLRRGRRYAIVGIVALAAVITPPDVFSQIALSLPLYLLYEVAILLCKNSKTESNEGQEARSEDRASPEPASCDFQ
ncbi:MAG: twin-arginine translocase subunit TatC [Alphaproteobacteria bacterium]